MRAPRVVLAAVVLAALLLLPHAPTDAHYRISVAGVRLSWSDSAIPVSYVINENGSDDISDDSELLAIQLAFDTWEAVVDSDIAFAEALTADASRTDWTAFDIHLILFDEDNSTGLFPGASGTIALTPITFNSATGKIIDADIIFNGADNAFSTDRTFGSFDVQAIATHEIGHLIGLDHSGCLAATMFPFADTRSTTPRALSSDDRAGVIAIYPLGTDNLGAISGFVERNSDGAAMPGAHVVAVNDNGQVVASTFSASNGGFLIDGLPADNYTVYAEPLDRPVQSSNLTSTLSVSTAFGTTFLGGATPMVLTVPASVTITAGTIAADDAHTHNLTTSGDNPYIAVRGGITSVLVVGEDLDASDTITVSGADVTPSSQMFLAMGALDGFLVNLTVGATAVTGPRNLVLETTGGERTILSGAIEVLDPAPTVAGTTPASGSSSGGDTITVSGTGFQDGAIVILADQQATVLAVNSATQITVTTPALSPGTVRVQVQNPDGQLGQNASGFTVLRNVSVDSVNPTAGSAGGGTGVTIAGNEFLDGATVTFGGVGATVTSLTATEITCVAPPGAVGTVDVQVTNPDTTTDTLLGAYSYVADPDPSITSVDPSSGPTAGGSFVRIIGSNFAAGASVFVDQATSGSGGTALTSVLVLDPNTIEAFTPSHAAGSFSITVTNPAGSSARLAAAYTYVAPPPPPRPPSSGSGGGGCLAMVPVPPGSPPTPPGNGLPLIVLLGALLLAHTRTRRAIPSRARPRA